MSTSTTADRPDALPRQRTSLVGRRDEVAVACALLVDEAAALLTLVGPPGSARRGWRWPWRRR